MSNISGLLGTAGGFKGTGVESPDMNYVSPEQLSQAYQQNQTALANQGSLLSSLQAQNGLQNQSTVYNQMQGIANGTGPNPAQAQLAQATSANTANQAALMAGQRGSSANTGLIARQAAMQGGANQQNAAGQAATLQAQQSMAGIQAAGQMANTMASNQVGQTNANAASAQAEQSSLLNANNAQNNQRSNLITATAGQQASFGGGMANGIGSAMGSSAGAEGGRVADMPKMAAGGMFGKLGSVFSKMLAEGGDVDGGAFQGQSKFGQFLATQAQQTGPTAMSFPIASGGSKGGGKPKSPGMSDAQAGAANEADMEQPQPGPADTAPDTGDSVGGDMGDMGGGGEGFAKGGKVPVLLSPGEKKLTPQAAQAVARGVNPDQVGQDVAPGVKPKVGGAKNSYANDVVRDELDPGTIILPRSVTQSKHPHWAAMKFVQAHMSQKGHMPKKGKK